MDLTVDQIAGLTGFGTPDGLRTVFRNRLHLSSTQYRQAWSDPQRDGDRTLSPVPAGGRETEVA